MTDKIKIAPAKGRPMLGWVGKKPLDFVKSFPAQLLEIFDPNKTLKRETPSFEKLKNNWHNLLFQGDNKEVFGFLLANGFRESVDLVYIDPPFDSNANYIRKVELRATKERAKVEGEGYTLGEQIQYTDIWANDNYLQFMYERLLLLKELLAPSAFIFLHCDYHRGHYLKLIMDEVFGPENFRNEIVVKRVQKNFVEGETIKSMNNAYDTILMYSKSPDSKFLPPLDREAKQDDGEENWHGFDAPNWSGGRPNLIYELFGQYPPPGNVWRWTKERTLQAIKEGTLRKNPKTGKPEYLVVNKKGAMVNNLWADILAYSFREDYPTEKSEKLLRRIMEIATDEETLVLDAFVGSGTAAAVAQEMRRRWIAIDINKGAIQTSSKRLQEIIKRQLSEKANGATGHFAFAVYNVNDYDLQLLGAEAKELAIEHIGIERNKTDQFFDGTLGKNLVRIIDFNHPLTLLDLQLIQDEFKKRPDENRNVTVVCLGKELAVNNWLDDYNKKHPVNKIDIIELRTDSKYGRFLAFRPPAAKIEIKRDGNKAKVGFKDFISPSIIERLNDPERLVKVKISDFRSMIDVVLIDTDYDGKTFNIVYSDVPESKSDLVKGAYEIDIPKKKTTIAVKTIDMLGQECLVTKSI
jgi:adenine-specific DNA-methyltransferase